MNKIKAYFSGKKISTNDALAFSLHKKSSFGEPDGEKIIYQLSEAFYLLEKEKLEIYLKNKKISKKEIHSKFEKIDKRFSVKYPAFKNLRERGYVLKTGLKFGADFRIYEKSAKKTHAKWLLICENESKKLPLHELSAKIRVSHSTRKKLLLAVLDEENKITYFEIDWVKP
jgi:tRNA-intron endonuclease